MLKLFKKAMILIILITVSCKTITCFNKNCLYHVLTYFKILLIAYYLVRVYINNKISINFWDIISLVKKSNTII